MPCRSFRLLLLLYISRTSHYFGEYAVEIVDLTLDLLREKNSNQPENYIYKFHFPNISIPTFILKKLSNIHLENSSHC